MNDIFRICSRIYTLHQLPLSLVDRNGQILQSWPEILKESVRPEMTGLVIQDFTLQNRDARHPLVSFIQNGFFVGAVEIEPETQSKRTDGILHRNGLSGTDAAIL